MKSKFILPLAAALTFTLSLFSCSNGHTEINAFITSMDNYALSIENATSLQEIGELDQEYAVTAAKYADSKAELTDADRTAIMNAILKLSKTTNSKITELSGGMQPLSDSLFNERAAAFKDALDQCSTLGEAVNMGL